MRPSALWTFACLVVVALAAGCAEPQETRTDGASEDHVTIPAPEMTWSEGPPALPAGARMVVLAGDPSVEGPFVLRFEVPAGYRIPPHTHPAVEHVTILSGTAYLGMGAEGDGANATELPPGSYFQVPAGMPHHFRAGDGPVTLQLHGTGPWGIEYVDPEDDPRNGPAM